MLWCKCIRWWHPLWNAEATCSSVSNIQNMKKWMEEIKIRIERKNRENENLTFREIKMRRNHFPFYQPFWWAWVNILCCLDGVCNILSLPSSLNSLLPSSKDKNWIDFNYYRRRKETLISSVFDLNRLFSNCELEKI